MQAQHDEHEADEGTRTPAQSQRRSQSRGRESVLEPLLLPSRVVLCTDIVVHKRGRRLGREVGGYELQMDGTPLGRRGIAAVAGGHCVGLPLKCNHSRAKASGSSRGSDRAKQSRYTDKHKQPPQGHALAKMSKVAGGHGGQSGQGSQICKQGSTALAARGMQWQKEQQQQVQVQWGVGSAGQVVRGEGLAKG